MSMKKLVIFMLALSVTILVLTNTVSGIIHVSTKNTWLGMVGASLAFLPIWILGFIFTKRTKQKYAILYYLIRFAMYLFVFVMLIIFIAFFCGAFNS